MSKVLEARSERFELICADCASVADAPSVRNVYCDCGGVYDIRYFDASDAVEGLPLAGEIAIDLGQGNTPLVRLDRLAEELGIGALWTKLEFCSPTGSFKDRGSAVLVSAGGRRGDRGVRRGFVGQCRGVDVGVCGSSGDAGAYLCAVECR